MTFTPLRHLSIAALDVGNQDNLATSNRQLDESLTRLDVPHTFEVYDGDHGHRVGVRFETKLLPCFSTLLAAPR